MDLDKVDKDLNKIDRILDTLSRLLKKHWLILLLLMLGAIGYILIDTEPVAEDPIEQVE